MTPYLDPAVYGCASVDPYSYSKRASEYRLPAFRGRPRYRLRDIWASYEVDVSYTMDAGTFAAWQSFWRDSIANGSQPFAMWLMLSTNAIYYSGEVYTAKAIGQWSGTMVAGNYWHVKLRVELPGSILVIGTLCDVLYGGPIYDPALDSVYGGPITDLAADNIAPCGKVLRDG